MNRAILGFSAWAARTFYRLRELGDRLPAKGPLLIVANHPNGLIDPVLVGARTSRPVHFLAKEPLFRMPILGRLVNAVGALPVYRAQDQADTAQNDETFQAVHSALAQGQVVALFPEGRSHDEPSLQRLKTGAARMALGAEQSAGWELGVRIAPIGLHYRHKAAFRSAATSWVGPAIECADLKALHESQPWEAVQVLNKRIATALRSVTVELERAEDLSLLELAERLWPRDSGDPHDPGGERVRRIQALARGFARLRVLDPGRARDLVDRIAGFRQRLDSLGIPVEDLGARYSPGGLVRFSARNLLALGVGIPTAVLGMLLWGAPYLAVRGLARREGIERDVIASVALLSALLLFPMWLALLCALLWYWASLEAAAALLLLAIPLGLFTVASLERRREAAEDAAVFFRLLRLGELRARLSRRRDELAREIAAASQELAEEG